MEVAMAKVQPDWRIVKVDQTRIVGEQYLKERKIKNCGMYYLIDANLHVYICSLTPCHEAFAMHAFVNYESFEAFEADDGLAEIELMDEEDVSYFDTGILRNPSKSAENYLPDREEDETDEEYRNRVPDEVREYLCGNPVSF
jgi:hypothetical protein